ncbi:MAG: 3-hydroxyisobutyrate dehydrogenase, partial [Acidobacteria bacterium RIFCSPLOWO2_12_FULL_54_10]
MPERIGFIGLGIMGLPMARNLMKAGYGLIVFNRTRQRAEPLAEEGAVIADSPAEVGKQAKVIFLCVGDSAAVSDMATNLLQTIQAGSLVMDASTISPTVSRGLAMQFAAKGVDFLDTPCSGSRGGAESATLTFMVGGTAKAFERAKPYLTVMGKSIIHVGESGLGLQAKLTQNLIGALTIQAMAEGFTLARKAGVAPSTMLEVLKASVARSPIIEAKLPAVMARNFKANFSLKWMHKDLGLMLESGSELGVPLPATGLVRELFGAGIALGHGEEDFAAA